jgi:hypothetical protein
MRTLVLCFRAQGRRRACSPRYDKGTWVRTSLRFRGCVFFYSGIPAFFSNFKLLVYLGPEVLASDRRKC